MPAPRATAPARSIAAASVAPASVEVVKARDEAILAALKVRPWPYGGLLTVLPDEPGQTFDQRETALKSALIRLRVKKLICEVGDVWRLV